MGFVVLLLSSTEGWSLPSCPGSPTSSLSTVRNWTDCFGTFTYKGTSYVGEYKDGKQNGHGTYTFDDGSKYVGEYKDGKQHGQGTYTFAGGRMVEAIFENGKFVRKLTKEERVSAEKKL